MSRTDIRFDEYKVKAFLDTNIILEGRPLPDLPWQDIDADGPIIALLTPKAMTEIDSKKQDGRLGKRAREFNRLISPVAAGGPPLVIRESGPRVELALSRAKRIPWDEHDELDPDDGDSRIVAEALYARDMCAEGKLIVSHDIKPINIAANYDIDTLHVSDNWLRQPEPGPADKEVQRLKGKLAEYEAKEPEFDIAITLPDGEPVAVSRIADLSEAERKNIEHMILDHHPKQSQTADYGFQLHTHDYSYDERYSAYLKQVPVFMKNYEERVERLFNQARLTLKVANIGKLQAENLLVEVNVEGGWIHNRFVWVSPDGPTVPKPRTFGLMAGLRNIGPQNIPPRVGRHEVAFQDRPKWRASFSVTCEDFRHGQDWVYEAIVGFDPRAPETKVTVSVSASNFRGRKTGEKIIGRAIDTVPLFQLVELNTLEIIGSTPIHSLLDRKELEDSIDWKAFAVGDEDDED